MNGVVGRGLAIVRGATQAACFEAARLFPDAQGPATASLWAEASFFANIALDRCATKRVAARKAAGFKARLRPAAFVVTATRHQRLRFSSINTLRAEATTRGLRSRSTPVGRGFSCPRRDVGLLVGAFGATRAGRGAGGGGLFPSTLWNRHGHRCRCPNNSSHHPGCPTNSRSHRRFCEQQQPPPSTLPTTVVAVPCYPPAAQPPVWSAGR